MNWKCLFGKHEWKEKLLPFTHWTLRECSLCERRQIRIGERWIPFEGDIAIVALSMALSNAMGRPSSVTPQTERQNPK